MPRLTLSRQEGETIIIDHDIRVTVRTARSGRSKITIDAPAEVDIIREELEGVLEIEPDPDA